MKRHQFLFRPNPHSDLHQRAWAYLQTCPTGQKNDYIAWAIICSLTDEQAKRYQEMFLQPELFVGYKDNIMKLKYDDPNLPDAPESAKQAYKERHNLPEYCFCPVPDIFRTVSIPV